MRFTIDVVGQKEVVEIFHQCGERARDLTPAWPDFRGHMRAAIEWTFKEEGRPEKWKKSRRVETEGGQTLARTGALKNSITFDYDATSFTMGTSDIRAGIHQRGGTIIPKSARSLAIPIEAPPRIRPRDFLASLGPKNFFVRPGRGGEDAGVIFQKLPGGKLRPLYALRKSVTMPARPFLQVLPENLAYLQRCILRHILGEK